MRRLTNLNISKYRCKLILLIIKFILIKNIISIFVLIFTLISCSNESSELANNKLRADFLKDKTFEKIKLDYRKLEAKKKVALWNEKLNQILTQEINSNVKELIINLQLEFKKEHNDLKNIRQIGLELTKFLSQDEFDDMFLKLEDFKPKQYAKIPVYSEIIDQLKNNKMEMGNPSKVNNSNAKYAIDCSCNWTCSTFCPNGSTTSCNSTSSGCGFLWAFECEYACK